jgi:hypothetical protein
MVEALDPQARMQARMKAGRVPRFLIEAVLRPNSPVR